MTATRSFVALLALTLATMAALATVAAPPAHADRCEPTELIVRAQVGPVGPIDRYYEEPGAEEQKPTCWAMDDVVYPMLGCDNTTLMSCLGSLNPNTSPTVSIQQENLNLFAPGCPNPDYPCTPVPNSQFGRVIKVN